MVEVSSFYICPADEARHNDDNPEDLSMLARFIYVFKCRYSACKGIVWVHKSSKDGITFKRQTATTIWITEDLSLDTVRYVHDDTIGQWNAWRRCAAHGDTIQINAEHKTIEYTWAKCESCKQKTLVKLLPAVGCMTMKPIDGRVFRCVEMLLEAKSWLLLSPRGFLVDTDKEDLNEVIRLAYLNNSAVEFVD